MNFASEWMTTKVEARKEEIRTEAERKQKAIEEAEQKKFEGSSFFFKFFIYVIIAIN